MKKHPVMTLRFSKKVHDRSKWNRNQDAVFWENYLEHKSKYCDSGGRLSRAAIVENLVPADCINREISQ